MVQSKVEWFNRETNGLRHTQIVQCNVEWFKTEVEIRRNKSAAWNWMVSHAIQLLAPKPEYISMWRNGLYLLGIPIDRVPTSKSCVFCIGMDSFFPERIISLKLMCYARRYKLGSEKSQSSDCCGFTNLLYKSLKCHEAYFFERIKQLAEEAIGNI